MTIVEQRHRWTSRVVLAVMIAQTPVHKLFVKPKPKDKEQTQ